MPTPSLQTFIEALQNPSEQLCNSLGGGTLRLVEGADGSYTCRLSLHTEVQVQIENRSLLLSLPHNAEAEARSHRVAVGRASIRTPHLGSYQLLPNAITYFDALGNSRAVTLVVESLPEGRPLSELLAVGVSAHQIRAAAAELLAAFRDLKIAHNNLKPENLWLTPEGRLVAVRCHRMSFEGCSECDRLALEAICRLADENDSAQIDLSREPEYRLRQNPAFEFVGRMSDGLILIRQKGLYGFADCHDRIVIEPRFLWADDFREGRAEVKCASGFGVIDKRGEFVLNPCFDSVEWDDMQTTIRARLDDRELLFGYNGEILISN